MRRKNEIVVYQPNEMLRLGDRILDECVWLMQVQIVELFGTKYSAMLSETAKLQMMHTVI